MWQILVKTLLVSENFSNLAGSKPSGHHIDRGLRLCTYRHQVIKSMVIKFTVTGICLNRPILESISIFIYAQKNHTESPMRIQHCVNGDLIAPHNSSAHPPAC